MKCSFSYIAFATLFASAPITALAQEADKTGEIIVTASRIGLAPRQVGSAFTIIDAQEIQTKQIQFAKDILEDAPEELLPAIRNFLLSSERGPSGP